MHEVPLRCSMVSVVCVRGSGPAARTLLLRRAKAHLHGVWAYVAGHVEAGERAWQAALRELEEETGLRPAELYSADSCETYYDAGEECIAVVPAFVALVDAASVVRLDAEHDDHAWLPFPAAIARLPFGGQRSLFEHVLREFVMRAPCAALRMPLA